MAPGRKHEVKRRERVELYRCRLTRGGKKGRAKLKLLPHTPSKRNQSLSPRKHSSKSSVPQRSARRETEFFEGDVDHGEFVTFDLGGIGNSGSKTTHEYMGEWVPKERLYLHEILDQEALPNPLECHGCHGTILTDVWRCKDCLGKPVYCTDCCRQLHSTSPLHRVQLWKDSHFQPSWLWKSGVHVSLCKSGTCASTLAPDIETPDLAEHAHVEPALDWTDNEDLTFGAKPNQRLHPGSKIMCVVHTNGVHYLPFVFCRCAEAPSDEVQLLRHGFYPATFRDIRTVFTHALLDDYLLEMLECFTSTHHYYSKLRRVTNKNFPHSVPDRTRELRRAGRQWRRLKDLKRFGFGHTRKTPGRGEMALFCAACPQPGINLPEDWKDDRDDWKYQRSLVADGNFVLVHRKQKRQGEGDVFLKSGEGYMTERTRYKEHLKAAEERKESNRQVNMDYGFCEALKTTHTDELSKVLLVYDINCQYSKHLFERIEEADHLSINEKLTVIFGIGLFHVHGHQDSCFARYALTFIRGAGMSAGEILEPLWSVINLAAGPTSMMTLAQRDEALDDFILDNNWKKLLGLVPSICKRWEASRIELSIAEEDFELLDETASDAQRR
ncbi:hypothetical protein CC1G_09746 [Coprinopsis cinerea okayama7|uniref:CxC2-like cysteine cluster KDZ transposase-associated domain-containing protein n=1 Tax=Coprinopsis cinerea (strain Okayama-7 / 130 / ATCC MYA-4618 / FGSC 9003) TaxID=240176 RepID=A8PDZ8_COPC7|nr:hypothetical protein CC1G_09746 [Coprinopsis cinerea okayama7\|eukprot:XP_001840695.2 hypothetical protein CC1G_09746 [Coprinopsis cinerea okayama7\